MRKSLSFLAGLAAGVLVSLAVTARADWNDSRGGFPTDTRALERIADATSESNRHLSDIARAQAETSRAIEELGRRCR